MTRRNALAAVAGSLLAACSSPAADGSTPASVAGAGVGALDTIVLVVMENQGYDGVVGNPAMPFLNGTILPASVSLTDMHADAHPSLPNYVWMSAGEGCDAASDDDWDRTCPSVFDQMLERHIDWTVFAEGYPGGPERCATDPFSDADTKNDYARKHNPALLFATTSSGPACTEHVRNLPGDVVADGAPPAASFHSVALPSFAVLVPNQCHDMHNGADDCGSAGGGVEAADRWLSLNWPDLVAHAGPHGVVILTWDEGDGEEPIATLISGGGLLGTHGEDGGSYDHASTLRAIEDALGLPCLSGACAATPIPLGPVP